MPSSSHNSFFGGTPCGEDCGQLGISMEEEPQSAQTLASRGANLLALLERENVDLNTEVFYEAIEQEAEDYAPREAIVRATEYGLGDRPTNDLRDDESSDNEPSTTSARYQPKRLPELLAERPMTTTEVANNDDAPDIEDYVKEYETPEGNSNIVYLNDCEEFAKEFDVNVGDHSDYAVAKAIVRACRGIVYNKSQRDIRGFIAEIDDRFSQFILSAAVVEGPPPQYRISDHETYRDSFRDTSVWPLVKEKVAGPVIGVVRNKEPVSTDEIAEERNERLEVINKIVGVLRESETLTSKNGKIQYVEPGDRASPQF
jgi:hypothetical protein